MLTKTPLSDPRLIERYALRCRAAPPDPVLILRARLPPGSLAQPGWQSCNRAVRAPAAPLRSPDGRARARSDIHPCPDPVDQVPTRPWRSRAASGLSRYTCRARATAGARSDGPPHLVLPSPMASDARKWPSPRGLAKGWLALPPPHARSSTRLPLQTKKRTVCTAGGAVFSFACINRMQPR